MSKNILIIRFIGLSDNADTENRGNKKARQINGLVNEWYLEDVSNNIRSAFYSKMKQGELISPFAPFGYIISKEDNNKLEVDPIASFIVKKIYDLYLTGLGLTGIAKQLNKEKIPSPSLYKYQKGIKLNIISDRPREEIKWSAFAIKTILTNEVYIGNLIQGKRTTVSYKNHKIKNKKKSEWIRVENTHEAIIDKETFDKVQLAMRERTKPMKSTGKIHLFSGKIFCLECKHYMRKKNSKDHEYLSCSSNQDGYENCINKKAIRYDQLESIILDAINKRIKKYYDENEFQKLNLENLEKKKSERKKDLEMQKKEIKSEISKTKNYLKSLYEDKVNKIITQKQFQELMIEYNKKEESLKVQIERINEKIEEEQKKEKKSKNKKFQKLKKLNQIIIDEFINKIYIGKINLDTNTRDIAIEWNLK